MLGRMTTPTAEYFDEWYSNLATSTTVEQIAIDHLGLPPGLESTSLLPWAGIADLVDALAVDAGDTVVDLACGRGGYALEVAKRTGARMIGIDFAAVAVERASQKAAGTTAQFLVGDLVATGLDANVAAGVMCIDAMQFADPFSAGLAECLRILAPGGRLALTGWQARDLADAQTPERMRRDIAAELGAVGFDDVRVSEMPEWRAAELAYWQAGIQLDPHDDAGAAALRSEGEGILPIIERTRRVLATARKPAASG
jgi:SAM-dependent methyltransferase